MIILKKIYTKLADFFANSFYNKCVNIIFMFLQKGIIKIFKINQSTIKSLLHLKQSLKVENLGFKKVIASIISYTLIYSQITFTFFITQSIISIVSTNNVYAFNEIIPPQNIKDNPINHIEIDNSVNIPNNNDNRNNGNNAYLDRAQNGTPMVNINNANNQGISANYYKDFNVDNQNLILNNYKGESVNTNLGGVIYGNPNFNVKDNNGNNVGREADIILNEITTNRVSNINGYIEVAGRKADVIIANPNGLMVGGAGFINTSRLSMITGRSLNENGTSFDSNGNLNPFLLTDTNQNPNAIIQVVGQNVFDKNGNPVAYNLGIDAKDVKYADLISRIVKLNGNIVGSDNTEVNIKTGNDKAQYNKNTGFAVSSKTEGNTNKPEFAIDSTAFGGIYAGRIKFIATEDGVGVRTRSDLVASVDDIDFDVNGDIILKDTGSLQAKKDINLTNNNPSNNKKNIKYKIVNNSYIVAENNIKVKTYKLVNNTANSKLYALNDINITDVNSVDNSNNGTINAGNDINVSNSSLIDNSNGGVINAGNTLNISNNDTLNNQNGSIVSNNKIEINSNNLDNSNKGYIYSSNDLYINILNNLNNTNNAIIEGDGNITIISKNIDNTNGTISSTASNTNTNRNNTNNTNNSTTRTLPTNQTQNSNSSSTPILSITSQNSLNNNNGNIRSNGDITINIDKDYTINGTLYSNSNITINAKNITNNSDVISANDIIFNAIGNIINGSASNLSTIIAMNDITLNTSKDMTNIINELLNYGISQTELDTKTQEQLIALCQANTSCNQNQLQNQNSQYNTTGNLYNYGKISANNDLTINAEDSIYNGLINESNATISGNNSVNLVANKRLINKGFIQAVGKTDSNGNKIENTGKLNITTNAEINSDYELGGSKLALESVVSNNQSNQQVSAEVQAKLDNIDNITDFEELNDLLIQIKTEDQYYLVQNRIRVLDIQLMLNDLSEEYSNFNTDDWQIGNTIKIYEEDPNNPNNYIEKQVILTEELLQEKLQEYLLNNYDPDDWDITQSLQLAEQDIDQQIADQLARKQEAEDNEQEFNEVLLNKEELMQTAKSNIENQRLALIQERFNTENQKVETAKAINWNTLTNEQTQENLQTLLQNNYSSTDWVIADYNDTQSSLAMVQNQYLSSLRINTINKDKAEKTGIHNYGRLYSNNDMTLNSNSVLHNNKGALIYSNNNINFNINKILFNNENNIGQGIYAKNNINILGYNSTSSKNIYNRDGTLNTNWGKGTNHNIATGNNYSLETLFNYDGLIEAEKNINILADDVVNYGSDSIDLSKIDNEIKAKYKYYIRASTIKRLLERDKTIQISQEARSIISRYAFSNLSFKRREISKAEYDIIYREFADTDFEGIGLTKEFQYYYVEESPELLAAYYLAYKETAHRNAGLYETIVKGYYAAYSKVNSNSSTLKSNNGSINIRANNTTNYNSLIFAQKNITIKSDNLLNTNLKFNVNSRQRYQYHGKDCGGLFDSCEEFYNTYTQPFVTQATSTKPSQILSNGSLVIVANKIGNGATKDYSNYTNSSSRLPYTSQTIPENAIDNILKSGTLNPLTLINLPQGNYGIFRKPADPNSKYLFETDPTLVDTSKFLGSVYFMNRLGLDPYTIDLKFLGDAYMEFELLKRSIEQTRLMQHTYNNTDEVAEQINKMREATTRELANKLGLEVGKELTQEQIDNLEEDIIWYVEQSIELPSGEIYTALVPQIYYCKASLQKMEQQRIANTTYTLIAGDSVYLQSKHSEQLATATINNSGTIRANDTLSIQNFDTINNITSSIRNEDINSLSKEQYNNQATLSAGNTLIINSGENGVLNNLSGLITLNNTNNNTNNGGLYDNLLYINTGTINNLTLSQQESFEHKEKNYEFNKISTYIGDTATISSNNANSNIVLNADKDINIMGADILAKEDNSNITLNAGNDINISTIQDYEYQRQYIKRDGGTFGESLTKENVDSTLTNIQSNITAGSNLSITTGNDLTSIGTNFTAINGNMDFNIGNDLNLYNATDYVYNYDYELREKFDLGSALANVGAAVAVGALTGGAGAAVMAGAASSMGASQMTKGSVDIKLDYDETTIGNNLKGNNINISTGNNATLISTNINAMNNINLDIGNELLIGSAEEKHEHKQSHESWGGDIGKAALGGAITGLATGLGVNAGAYMGAYSGVALGGATSTSALAGAYTGGILLGGSAAMGSSGVGAVISKNEQGELKGTYTTNQIGSDLTAINDINITTNNNLNIVGSDLLSGNNTILTSNNGSVNILAAIETIITEESKTKTAGKGVKFNHSGGSYTIDGKVEKKTNSNQTTTQMARSSNIKSANSVVINSGNNNNTENRQDINIMGSNIIAENDILLNSEKGNINVISQELLKEVLNKEQVQTITISTGISNTFIKTAKDAKNAMEHKNGYQDNKEGNISAGVNLAFDALNNYLTLGTLGFGFSTSVSYNNTETNTSQNAVFNQGSAIISNKGSIDLNAEKDINIKGSMISTEGENKEINLTSNTGNINIIASKDVVEMSSDTDSNSYSFGGGAGSVSPTGFNFGYDKSTSNTIAYSERYNNSTIENKNGSINIRTKNTNDTDKGNVLVSGANIEGKDINIDVANNLIVESLQNKEYSNTKSENYGGSVGGSAGAFGLNFGGGFDKKERNWVDNQTSIIGNNSVVINTKNNTNIKGAIIASGSYEDVDIPETEWTTDITSGETTKTKRVFKDNGNLVLNTGSLTYSDIYDNNTEKNQNLNVGLGTTINFGFSNGGVDIEQTTKATIGNGKITIGGHTLTDNETITQDGTIVAKSEENIGINRDVNNSQEITKNETTGGWNIDVSVNIPELLDLIDKGPEQYTKDQINKAKENINKVKEQINKFKDIVVDFTDAIISKFKDNGSNTITEDDIRQIIENNKDSIDEMAKQYVNLNETDLTEEQVKAILTKLLLEQGITLALNGSLEGLGITKDYLERGGLIALVQAIETQGGTRFENLNWYATDENGNLFKKAVQCSNGTCYHLEIEKYIDPKDKLEKERVKKVYLPKDSNGKFYVENKDGTKSYLKTDENGRVIKVLSPAYIPSTGKYDAMSLGKIHWAGNKNGQDRGLDYLLQDAKTNYPEFYNDYIKIAGTDENGKPITDTTNMTTSQLKELKTFIKSYDTEDFKNYEVKAAERIYFTEPVSKLPTEVQDRINNSPLIVQQIIMSTYVQFGSDNKDINKAINNFGNPNMSDKDILEKIFYEKELKGHSNRADLERQALDLFYQLQKGKK